MSILFIGEGATVIGSALLIYVYHDTIAIRTHTTPFVGNRGQEIDLVV